MGGKHLKTTIRAQGVKFTKERREQAMELFLDAYKSSGNIRASCMAAGIDRQTVHYWCEHYEEFAFRYNEADTDVDDLIDAELLRRAVHGETEVVTSMGKVVYDNDGNVMYNTKRSDALLMFIAKSRMPKYKDKQAVELSGSVEGTGAKESLLAKLANIPVKPKNDNPS